MAFLSVNNLFSAAQQGGFSVKNFNLEQQQFEKIVLCGETGSGKTTVMKMIAGLLQPAAGSIVFADQKMRGPDFQLIAGHKGMAYLSQHFELRHHYRMEELLEYSNVLPVQKTLQLFELCRISHLLKRRHDELSGGEMQRVALAKLLLSSPRLLLLDEPFSNMDLIHKKILKGVIADVADAVNISIILTSHDPADTLPWADKIVVMQRGEIVQTGAAEKIYHAPDSEYVAGLFGDYNVVYLNDENDFSFNHAKGFKKMLVRPGEILLSKNHGGIRGLVSAIKFQGAFFLVEVLSGNTKISVHTHTNEFEPAEEVSISLVNTVL